MTPQYEIYKDKAGQWRWRFRAGNGKIMADSAEGYCSAANVFRAIRRFEQLLTRLVNIDWTNA